MARRIILENQHVKQDTELLSDLHKAALIFSEYADHNLLFIYSGGKGKVPECYEVHYGSEHFMHLSGFRARRDAPKHISAKNFFKLCCEDELKEMDWKRYFEFTESRKESSGKLDALLNLFDYCHIKIYKIGPKSVTTSLNKFEIGIGNQNVILGFDKREYFLPIPVTAMKRALSDFTFVQKNIIAVLKKKDAHKRYSEVVDCIASGIERESLPEEIRCKISEEVDIIHVKK